MSAELIPDLSQCLVAYAGEVITCPKCGDAYAVFEADAFGTDWPGWPVSRPILPSRGFCECGTAFGVAPAVAPRVLRQDGGVDLLPQARYGIRLHIRSGSWTGWRDLGGE